VEYYEGVAFKFLSVFCHTSRASIRGDHSHIPLGTALIPVKMKSKVERHLRQVSMGQEALETSVNGSRGT